jgi:hypothetical protein
MHALKRGGVGTGQIIANAVKYNSKILQARCAATENSPLRIENNFA